MRLFDYSTKLNNIGLTLTDLSTLSSSDERLAFLNAYNLINDCIDEIVNSPLTLGQRIDMLYSILNHRTTQNVVGYISKNSSYKIFSKINSNTFYSNIFSKMLDAYLICERDSASAKLIMDVMHHNIYLYDLNNIEFLMEYPEILKKVYANDLEGSLKDICKILGGEIMPRTEISAALAKLLTYLSAALELPDVYLYSKKLDLDLSILRKDYFAASGIIKDLEYMNYKSNDLKYYKALIKQRGTQNLMYKYH